MSGRRYQRISLVAGLTNGELIAPMTYEETMTSDFFEAWFQKFLLPTLNKPSVIIMDNARFHRMGKLEILCEEFGHKLLPLPPYSPEYNPIEKTWAHIKKHLKKVLPNCNTFSEALLSCSCFNRLYETNYGLNLNKYKITEELAQINERFLGFHFIKSKRPIFSVDSKNRGCFVALFFIWCEDHRDDDWFTFCIFIEEWSNGVDNGTIDRLHAGILVFQCDTNCIEEEALALANQVARLSHVDKASTEDVWTR